jgi:hypothetical protein
LLLGYGIAPKGSEVNLGLPELSEYCSGWMEKTHKFGLSHLRYFEMLKHHGHWYWAWTEQNHSNTPNAEKLDKSVEASKISSVSPIPEEKDGFIVKYQDENKEKKTIMLKCIEGRSREAWVEGLRLFLTRYRSLHKQKRDSNPRGSRTSGGRGH